MYLDELVRGFLRDSDLRRQHEMLAIIRVECEALKKKDGALKSFPNFKKLVNILFVIGFGVPFPHWPPLVLLF